MKRTVKNFSRVQMAELARQYAETEFACSHQFFEQEYNISSSTFYNLLAKAIIIGAVNDKTISLIVRKAVFNSTAKAGEAAGIRSKKKYAHLIIERQKYLPKEKEILHWTILYSNSPLSKKSFCRYYCIDSHLLDKIILTAIAKQIITEETFNKLKQKSLNLQAPSEQLYSFWNKMDALYKKEKTG